MKALAFTFATLLLLALTPVQGDVVIYKGTLKNKGPVDPASGYPATISQYLFVNYATQEVHSLNYYTKNGQKLGDYTVFGPIRFAQAPFPAGKTGRVIVDATTTNASANSFTFLYTEYRGVQVSLTIRKIPGVTTLTEPKSLTVFDHTVVSSGTFDGLEGMLTFQSNATLDANAANQGIVAARDKIADDLRAKGYTIP